MRRIDRRSTRQAVAAGYVQPGSARVPISVVLTWLVIATLLAGCVGANPSDVSAGGGSARAVAANLPADISIMVYQGSEELGGEEVNLSEVLARGKPVVLNMWAGLCPVCRLEMAHLEEAYAAYGGQVVILGLDIGPFIGLGDRDDALALLAELDVSYPAGTTDDAAIVKSYQVLKFSGPPHSSSSRPTERSFVAGPAR